MFFFHFFTIFSIPAGQYSPRVYRETIYPLITNISMIFRSYTLVPCSLLNGGGMFVGSGTGLSVCKKSYCLSVPIAMSTLLKGWVTILLGGNRGKVAFLFDSRLGWD